MVMRRVKSSNCGANETGEECSVSDRSEPPMILRTERSRTYGKGYVEGGGVQKPLGGLLEVLVREERPESVVAAVDRHLLAEEVQVVLVDLVLTCARLFKFVMLRRVLILRGEKNFVRLDVGTKLNILLYDKWEMMTICSVLKQ
jgi:hypothetical protein